jgi:uncharacterized 2Fe-2S/4Fe-4S cluster protein (DUF4445 family)
MADSDDNSKILVTFNSTGQEMCVPSGSTIRAAAMAAGLDLPSPCGGNGRCGKCLVRLRGQGVSEPTLHERQHLAETDLDAGLRLACQTVVEADVHVELMGASFAGLEMEFLRGLPETLTDDGLRGDAGTDDSPVDPAFRDGQVRGLALDIGTTTLAGWLYDLDERRELAVAATLNPQGAYGADSVSRIQHALEKETGLADLQDAVVEATNGLILSMCSHAGVSPETVVECAVVGNTTMMHLFFGLSPRDLGLAPYIPSTLGPVIVTAEEAGLAINPAGSVYHLPCIGGFIGADTVGVIMSTGLNKRSGTHLAVDIGTNGEIVLCHEGRLLACSTAAGPALEGGEMACGMRAAPGAVDVVEIVDGKPRIHTIGDAAPRGICGSGIIDAVAVVCETDIIDPSGRMVAETSVDGIDIERHNGEIRAVFARGVAGDIYLTQRDIRRVQLAKGAIRVGIETLLDTVSVSIADVETVYLAGAFGNYLRPESAVRIGLLPPVEPERFRPVGNAAGAGARLALVSRRMRDEAVEIASTTEHIDLMADPGFQDRFAEAMFFPE